MKYFLLFICLFLVSNFDNSFGIEEEDDFEEGKHSICFGTHTISEPVITYCEQIGGRILYRCCRADDNVTFVALDLMNSNLTTIPDLPFDENLKIVVLDLRNNSDLEISSQGYEFIGLTYLNELLLPKQVECPGGHKIWENIQNATNGPEGWNCTNQISFCVNSTDLCVPAGSMCSPYGPNHFQCVCQTDYHGYKCLRHGNFPLWEFLGPTLGVTILASIILYWTHRRNVIKK